MSITELYFKYLKLILLPRATLSIISFNYLNKFYPSYFANINLAFDTLHDTSACVGNEPRKEVLPQITALNLRSEAPFCSPCGMPPVLCSTDPSLDVISLPYLHQTCMGGVGAWSIMEKSA